MRKISQHITLFLSLWWTGNDYYALSRWDWRASWRIAGVVADTLASIRGAR